MKRFVSLALVAALAACSGHSSGGVLPSTGGGHASKPGTPVSFSIKIPMGGTGVRPQHVSSATLGVGVTTYAQSDTGHTTPIGYFGNDVSPGSPACVTGPVFRVCSIQAAAPAGADEMVVDTYDQRPNGSGFFDPSADVLDTGNVDFTVVEGQTNTVSVALGGVPAQIDVAIDNPNAIFDTALYAGIPYNVEVSVVDASGATIIGSDPYATPIALSTSTGHASFTVDGTAASTLVTKPNSTITMVDASASHSLSSVLAETGSITGLANYEVNAIGTTSTYLTEAGPTAIASGTASNEVGQPGDLFYADANEEIVKFDSITKTDAVLSYAGAGALATTSIVQNRFAGIDVSFVTATDGSQVSIGNSDGSTAVLDDGIVAYADCAITNAATGDRIVVCGDTIADPDSSYSTTFPGRTLHGIAPGADGKVYYTFDAPSQGGIGAMFPADIGGAVTDTEVDLDPGHYGTAIVACPDGNEYFTDVDSSDGSTMIGSLVAGSVSTFPAPGPMTALTCGPNGDLYYGTGSGKIYRVPLATFTAALVADDGGGAIGGITLGPDGAIWATSTSQNELLRVIP